MAILEFLEKKLIFNNIFHTLKNQDTKLNLAPVLQQFLLDENCKGIEFLSQTQIVIFLYLCNPMS